MSIFNISTTLVTNNPKPNWQHNTKTINTNSSPALPETNLPGTSTASSFSDDRFLYGNLLDSSDQQLVIQYNDSLLIKYDNYLNIYNNINKAKFFQPIKN